MEFTFGICATKNNNHLHDLVIDSIYDLNIPNFEVLMVGGGISNNRAKCIPFDESIKEGWITKKKNILCHEAIYENIVLLHDYIIFQPGWYNGFLDFGEDFDVAMNVILNDDNTRFRDWCLNPYDVIPPKGPITNREFFLPYTEYSLTEKMYISGTYWIAKTKFMLDNPLNEELGWGESEDMNWSESVRTKTVFKMNPLSTVQCLKHKYCDFEYITPENLNILRSL